jgi:hypothetical protein
MKARREKKMAYSLQLLWEDHNKILYSKYYGALSDKQHATGKLSQKDFLTDKINLAHEMVVLICNDDSSFLDMLFTADYLSEAPFGIGGRRVLEEIYQYDKNAATLNIAREIQLSEHAIESLDNRTSPDKSAEVCLLQFMRVLDKLDVLTPELRQELLDSAEQGYVTKELMNRLENPPITPEQEEIIKRQEACMRYAISKPLPRHYDNPLEYWLGTKERDFAKLPKQP